MNRLQVPEQHDLTLVANNSKAEHLLQLCMALIQQITLHLTQTLYLHMELAVDNISFVTQQLECVTSISIHVLVSIRNSSITEQEAYLMSGLWAQSYKIPEHIRILQTFCFQVNFCCFFKYENRQKEMSFCWSYQSIVQVTITGNIEQF